MLSGGRICEATSQGLELGQAYGSARSWSRSSRTVTKLEALLGSSHRNAALPLRARQFRDAFVICQPLESCRQLARRARRKEDRLERVPPPFLEVQFHFRKNRRRSLAIRRLRREDDQVQPAAPNLAAECAPESITRHQWSHRPETRDTRAQAPAVTRERTLLRRAGCR